jgi:hypothetical protein
MRPELEQIETIEKYLKGELEPAQKAEFEKALSQNKELQKEVQLQKEIMSGIKRAALKQTIQKAYHKYIQGKNFLKWGSSGLGVSVITAGVLFFAANHHHNKFEQDLPSTNELGTKVWSTADRLIPSQKFSINPAKDTVIETKGGMVLAVPANCFLGSDGKPTKGPVQMEVKEALDPASIMKAGLSTKSDGKLLQSGGMFYINARENGASLKIDPNNGIYTEIPTDSVKAGMQLYQGKRMADGSINWVNPKPLYHNLVPVNIHSLNFYPPLYLDSLAKWGYNTKNKKFTDSLYFAFAKYFNQQYDGKDNSSVTKMTDSTKLHALTYIMSNPNAYEMVGGRSDSDYTPTCGINPAKVRTIWDDRFQNTLISTKEFEARMPYIHKTGDNAVLDTYVNNLDQNLSAIDSLVATHMNEDFRAIFMSFAARGDGKVAGKAPLMDKLKEFYTQRANMYIKEVAMADSMFWNEQVKKDSIAGAKKQAHITEDTDRVKQNLREEYTFNLKAACRMVGDADSTPQFTKSGYVALCTGTGWQNIDVAVYASTSTRTTLDYTDPRNGKKAIIRYLPMSVTVKGAQKYDQLFVYLLPNKLSSFMRLDAQPNGRYEEKLDELMQYKLVCLGYKGDSIYCYTQARIEPKDYANVALRAMKEQALNKLLNSLGSTADQSDAIQKEGEYVVFQLDEKKRKKEIAKKEELNNKLIPVIFPCWIPPSTFGTDTTKLQTQLSKK